MKRTLCMAALVAAALSGCAVSRPPAQAPAAVPGEWQAPLPHNGAVPELSQWWRQFDDPLLVDLVDAAQAVSPTVASARSRIEQVRAARVAAGAALLPAVDAFASAERGNSQPPLPLLTVTQAGLQASWEIDLFGGNRAAADAAQARLIGAHAGWHEARVSVAAETALSYIGLRTCQLQLAIADNDAQSRAETARLADLSERAGFTAPATAALARASASEGAARARQQRAQCEIEVKALVALTALPEPQLRSRLTAPGPGPARTAVLMNVASVPAQVLAQRPDIYQAELEVAAASADVGSARAQRFPRLSLSGSIAAGVVRTGGVNTDAQTWSVGPLALSLPVFDGGRRAADVDAAQARYEEAAALYRARVRNAVREVEESLVTLESTRAREEDVQRAVDGYRVSFAATQARWQGGLASLVELEEVRRTLLVAELTLVGLQRDRSAAWIALYRAVGGGWARPAAETALAQP
ncbi:efflux transporter outer membrane subunit [Ramlibacter solisilvae]|uniref:RND transporter n=1 Tax=Ramlibacter tataouinensis TaxID=94132 RepID=A0A127JT35_9BURK|nr:efflux transporter outer membrane subunit [Ramlibacter tataouinensis]AMO23106.1 RND transporter [Ramlibacter tataouinensis]